MGSPESNIEIIASGTSFFNTQSGEGDLTVVRSLKISARRAARVVLQSDSQNSDARAILRWANSRSSKMPRMGNLLSTFQTAGLETFSTYIKGSEQE